MCAQASFLRVRTISSRRFHSQWIACACLIHEVIRRPSRSEVVKAILLALAFLFWSANQLWPALRQATLFNDIAIGLFVFDVFLAMTTVQSKFRNSAQKFQVAG